MKIKWFVVLCEEYVIRQYERALIVWNVKQMKKWQKWMDIIAIFMRGGYVGTKRNGELVIVDVKSLKVVMEIGLGNLIDIDKCLEY